MQFRSRTPSQYPSNRSIFRLRVKSQIYVTFRGSATVRDWQIDGNMLMTLVPNPLKEEAVIVIYTSR
jgi:hypothetical protein